MSLAELDRLYSEQAAREMAASGWQPYSETAPQIDDLNELRAELYRVREEYGRGSSRGAEAYARLNAAAHRAGRPLDGLRQYSADEGERFFARIVPGPDGHVYWDTDIGRSRGFRLNGGKYRHPRRYWWQHLNGPVGQYEDIVATCDDGNCIAPWHAEKGRGLRRRMLSESALIGSLQVLAMRLGHSPSRLDWDRSGIRPSSSALMQRYGNSWFGVLSAAGLPAKRGVTAPATPASCIAAIRQAHRVLGHWPTQDEMASAPVRAALEARRLPTSTATYYRYLGRWREALRKAGKR